MALPDQNSETFLESLRSERRDLLNRLRQTHFSLLKNGYTQTQVIPYASYSPWLDDEAFQTLYQHVKSYTMVDVYRCYELVSLVRQMEHISGDLVEIGVWRGGTAALIAGSLPGKPIHLFDTFKGVAKADHAHDTLYAGGEHADTDQHTVERLFTGLGLSARINSGIFPDETLNGLPAQICMAHVDVDTFSSARDSFTAIWPKVAIGGLVIFDDFGFWGCEGVAQAVNEIRSSTPNALFVHNLNGHALMAKTM